MTQIPSHNPEEEEINCNIIEWPNMHIRYSQYELQPVRYSCRQKQYTSQCMISGRCHGKVSGMYICGCGAACLKINHGVFINSLFGIVFCWLSTYKSCIYQWHTGIVYSWHVLCVTWRCVISVKSEEILDGYLNNVYHLPLTNTYPLRFSENSNMLYTLLIS